MEATRIRPRRIGTRRALFVGRRPLAMLALGFSAGLPLVLVFDVLSLWLRESGVSLETIGFFSLVGLTYSLKFLWAPLLDRVEVPLLSNHLGRRRAWMLTCQLPIALGIGLMSTADPTRGLGEIAALALFVALLSATQDIAIDAWRIEVSAEGAEPGIMAAAYHWGYRIAVLVGGAVPLVLAGPLGWNVSYGAMATLMGIGVAATLVAPRETRVHASPVGRAGLKAAFGEPLSEFFRRHGSGAAFVLALVGVYRLPDLVRSIMGPFYLDLGFTLVEVAEIRRVLGMVMTMAGVAAGGLAVARLGVARAMVVGAVLATASSLGFAWLALEGRDMLAMVVTTGLEHASAGFAGTCLIAYMSSLTSPAFAATQFALLSSLFTLPGRLLASQSGLIVEAAARGAERDGLLSSLRALFAGLPADSYAAATQPAALGVGYLVFFLYSAALGATALILAVRVAHGARRASPSVARQRQET